MRKAHNKLTQEQVVDQFKNTHGDNYEVIKTIEGEAGEIWDLEESLHIKFKDYNHKPKKSFAGFSECYNLGLPIDKI